MAVTKAQVLEVVKEAYDALDNALGELQKAKTDIANSLDSVESAFYKLEDLPTEPEDIKDEE